MFSKIDVDALLDKIENADGYTSYLENKTLTDISREIYEAIHDTEVIEGIEAQDSIKLMCDRLTGYRYVDRVCDLRQGNHIKWIWRKTKVLTRGSRLFTVTLGDNGTILTCKNYGGKFIKINFDQVVVFQKLSMEEQLILMSYDYLDREEK